MKTFIFLLLIALPALAQTNRPAAPVVGVPAKPPEPKQIRISTVVSANPPYTVCDSSVGRIYVMGLPPTLKVLQDKIAKLTAWTTKEEAALKADVRALNREKAIAPSSASTGNANAYNWINSLNVRQNKLEERDEDLTDSVKELVAARKEFAEATNVHATDTGRKYGSYAIWQVVK